MGRWGIRLILLAGLVSLGAHWAAADDLWVENFTTGAPGTQPPNWFDASDGVGPAAQIIISTQPATTGYADVTVTNNTSGYGNITTGTRTVNVTTYPKLDVVITQLQAATVVISLVDNTVPASPVVHQLTPAHIGASGTYTFDIPSQTGLSGSVPIYLQIAVEAGQWNWAKFHSFRIYNNLSSSPTFTPTATRTATVSPTPTNFAGTPTFTPTVTPTFTITPTGTPVVDTNYWVESFTGTYGTKPPRWTDSANVSANNATISYDLVGVKITHVLADTYGQVLAPTLQVDTTIYPLAEINVTGLSPATFWNLGIQEIGGANAFKKNFGSDVNLVGKQLVDLNAVMGWAPGVHIFQFHVMVVGNVGTAMYANSMRVYRHGSLPAPVPALLRANGWVAHFDPTPGQTRPKDWIDSTVDPGKHLYLAYSSLPGYVYLSRTAQAPYGSVTSPAISGNVTRYPYLSISVTNMSPDARWKVGIADNSPDHFYVDLNPSWNLQDTVVYNYTAALQQYNNVTTWAGMQNFNIVLTMENANVQSVELSDLRLFGFGADPTSTVTVTPTITPWVQPNNVLAYPNPSRDRVSFAFRADEAVNVTLDIYKLTGERVGNVVEQQAGGSGQILQTVWDAVNVPPGVYLCHLKAVGAGGRAWVDVVKKVAIVK